MITKGIERVDVRLLELELKSSGIPFSTPEFRYRPLTQGYWVDGS